MPQRKQGFYERCVKPALDFICALLAVTVFFWLYLGVALLVRLKLGSPVLFKQPRPERAEYALREYKRCLLECLTVQYMVCFSEDSRLY